ncbi:MAG: radical SAM protein [Patescibacteria group bacterium]|nr:radical SAM protein [Patescibacteria group bacterium]
MNRPYIIFEVTPRCNNNCLYCYNVWKENKKYPRGELRLASIKVLFKKLLAEIKPKFIILSGGEPLLHPDIFNIVNLLYGLGNKVGLATNGTLLDEEKVRRLTKDGVKYFEISLDTTYPKTYFQLSGNNQLEKVRQAILAVKKFRIPLTASFTITKSNHTDIADVVDLCFAFSVDSIALNRFVPGGAGIKNIETLQISRRELEDTLRIANHKNAQDNIQVNITIPIEPCEVDHKKYPHLKFGTCGCGKDKWVIDPLGNLRTCEQNPEILGNLFDKNFNELSNLDEVKTFRQKNAKPICDQCQSYINCGGGCRFIK